MSSEIVNRLMFEYSDLSEDGIAEYAKSLPIKIIRWLGTHHPDNHVRRIFFQLTNVQIGAGTVLNQNLVISDNYEPLVIIGERVSIAPNVTIIAASDPNNSVLKDCKYVKDYLIKSAKVTIEDDTWIGTNVIILPGVTIGSKAIVGAGSVVTKDVPSHTIVAGDPAKIIRHLSSMVKKV